MATVTASRPTTAQSSIQSSNSGIIQIDNIFFTTAGKRSTENHESLYSREELLCNKPVLPLETGPLQREPGSSGIGEEEQNIGENTEPNVKVLSAAAAAETSPDFLNDSCVQFAFVTLSPAEFNGVNNLTSTTVYSEYTSSSKLSPQLLLSYNDLSPISKRAFDRKKVIEEIIETEEIYISSLRMLSGIYLETIINKGNNGIPIRLLIQYVDLLIASHSEFLNDLRRVFFISLSGLEQYDINEVTKHLVSSTSPLMSALIAEIIQKKAISIYIYQEYYSMMDSVMKLIDSKEDDPELGVTLTRGFQKFLESSSNERLDLSLTSLIHKPIQRISKYKLFLDNLLKLTPVDEDEPCHRKINDCSIQVDYSIKEINRYGLQEKIKAASLFNNMRFKTTLKFPVEYLGLPILIGSFNAVYVSEQNLVPKSLNFGAFLFKTHLILADISIKSKKYEVIFLIPLSVSKIISKSDDDNSGGFFTNYGNSFKILFEHQFKIYELLILNFNTFEHSIWKEKLEILINVVNGPYKLDYSASKFNEEQGTKSSTIIPQQILSYDVNLNKVMKQLNRKNRFSSELVVFNQCYFQEVVPVTVEFNDEEQYSTYSSRRLKERNSNNIIRLNQVDRTKIEYILEDLWSEELISATSLLSRKKLKQPLHSGKEVCIPDGGSGRHTMKAMARNSWRSSTSIMNLNSPNSTRRISLMRRTSIVFGDALKSLFSGGGDP